MRIDAVVVLFPRWTRVVVGLLGEIQSRVGAVHGLGEALATMDLVVGLTHTASLGGWVRPELSTTTLAITGGRHPILDILSPIPPVPNNTVS